VGVTGTVWPEKPGRGRVIVAITTRLEDSACSDSSSDPSRPAVGANSAKVLFRTAAGTVVVHGSLGSAIAWALGPGVEAHPGESVANRLSRQLRVRSSTNPLHPGASLSGRSELKSALGEPIRPRKPETRPNRSLGRNDPRCAMLSWKGVDALAGSLHTTPFDGTPFSMQKDAVLVAVL